MSPGIQIEIHFWRGIGPTVQRDLFFYGYRFGFVTIAICKVCVIDSYAKLREAVESRISADEKNAAAYDEMKENAPRGYQ